MFNVNSKSKNHSIANQQTGVQFFNPITHHQDQESFSYEIQMQKQYVQRLKTQRQKIQNLYSKYDVILSEMKKKDNQIKIKQDRIKTMDVKLKDLQLNCQQIGLIKQQNKQLMNQNLALKHRIIALQNENIEIMQQMKLKQCLVSDQKEQIDQLNQQLQDKLKSMNNKFILAQQQYKANFELQKQKTEHLKNQHAILLSQLNSQLNSHRNQLIKKDQTIHMLRIDSQFMRQKLSDQEENYSIYLKDLQAKIQKSQKQKKLQIKALKDSLEERTAQIGLLQSKIVSLKQQLQTKQLELQQSRKLLRQQKRIFDDDVYQLKSQMTNEKNYFRQQFMHCQNHIQKLQKKLSDCLKRQKQSNQRMKRFQDNEQVKRNLRQIERQEMQKINRILSFQP